MSQSALSELENDEYPTSAFTWRLAQIYGVNPRWLADGLGAMDSAEQDNAPSAPPTPSDWPFKRVSLERIQRLNEADLSFLEGKLDSILEGLEAAVTKKSPPQKRSA